MGKSQGPAIGIDLGTTYSCVAVLRDNKVTIVPNGLGTPTTPSFIAFDDNNQVTVGDVAKNQANLKPDNTIFDVKRLIGRSFNDPVVQKDIKLWPFHVFDDNGTPKIKVNNKTYYAEVISAKLLSNLRKQAEEFLGCPVQDAVITVPAYFNDGQRQATKDAGAIAGLNVLRIINEPTAAAIAYCHQVKPSKKKNILVFDLGGGTFDIAILSMDDNKIKVLAVGGDTHLGGEDFDAAMADHCIKEFETKHGINLADGKNSEDPLTKFRAKKFLRRLKNECEHQKMNLVGAKSASVSLENVTSSLDLNVRFTRAQFDALNNDMFEKCIQIIDQVLKDISMPKDDIDEIVMVGGSSKIVRIQEMVQDYFGGKQLSKTIRPDEAVAYGAAVQAALMTFDEESDVNNQANYDRNTQKTGKKPEPPKRIEIHDVIPLPVGIKVWVEEGNENDFCIILEKNTSVPSKKMKLFSTPHANCTQLDISVYEGESQSTSLNHLLGRFVLQNLPPHCRQGERIDVTMEVNDEGILHVDAECPATQSKGQITVDEFKGRLTPDEISNLMEELFVSHSTLDL